MTERRTKFGRVCIGLPEELFSEAVRLAAGRPATGNSPIIALSGGSTPRAWYAWCLESDAAPAEWASSWFTVSDERHVPLTDPESNFGMAARLLLDPLKIAKSHRFPWPVELPAGDAAADYERRLRDITPAGRTYDVCFLGLGDDAHTASLFPGSSLLRQSPRANFAAVEVPGRGWRLTITPAGLSACGSVVVLVLGAAKAPAVRRVFAGPADPIQVPGQVLQSCADRVVWLLDEAAASGLPSA